MVKLQRRAGNDYYKSQDSVHIQKKTGDCNKLLGC